MKIATKIKKFMQRRGVSVIMVGATVGFFLYDLLSGTNHSKYFLALLILFQIRGIIWEEAYTKTIYKLREELANKVQFAK